MTIPFQRSPMKKALLACQLGLLGISLGAQAQQPVLEEVIVTAQKREQNLQDVAIAVTAFSGDQVSAANISQLGDVAVRTPGLQMNEFNIGEPQLYIRGIGNSSDSAGSDPAVGIFIDEVYMGRSGSGASDLFDIERIEVLRGPQGTLYGKNTSGGALAIYTTRPSQEFYGKVSATVGDYSLWNIQGLVNGPLTDRISAKLSTSKKRRDGYADNITTGQELQDEDNFSIRGQMQFDATDNLSILLGANYSEDNQAGNCRHLGNVANSPAGALWMTGMSDKYLSDVRNCSGIVKLNQDRDVHGYMARVEWDLGWANFVSISAYMDADYNWIDDLTGVEPPSVIPTVVETVVDFANEDSDQFTQEFRLSGNMERFDWVAGLYYLEEEVNRQERFYTEFSALLGVPFPSPGDITFFQDNETTSYAAFGQVDWHLTDKLDLTLGLRYSYDEKDITQGASDNIGTYPPFSGIPLLLAPYGPVDADDDWDDWTPKAVLSYRLTDDAMVYASYSEGFKSGAFAGQATTVESAITAAEPETATNYEIGMKSQWWDNRLQLNVLAFYTDYEDLQVFFLENFLLTLANAEAESYGAELEYVALLTTNFQVSGSYAYNETEYTDFVTTRDLSGNDLARAPENSFTLVMNYTIPLSGGSTIDLEGSYFWKDEWYHDPNNDPAILEDDVGLSNASVTWTSASENMSVVAWGKNLGDEDHRVHSIFDNSGVSADVYGAPLTYGVTFNYRFE